MTLKRDRGRTTNDKPVVLPPERPYYYAWGGDKRMYAYTRDERGMGGSLPNGGNYIVRSWVVLLRRKGSDKVQPLAGRRLCHLRRTRTMVPH